MNQLTVNRQAIIIGHSGKQHAYYIARNLQLIGCLQAFYTSSYIKNPGVQNFVSSHQIHYFTRRFLSGLSGPSIHTNWFLEMPEIFARLLKINSQSVSKLVLKRDELFDARLSAKLPKLAFDTYWGFQGSCLKSLRKSNELGKNAIVEMTMAYLPFAKSLLLEEIELHPQWKDSIDIAAYPKEYEKRLVEEPQEASLVVAVSAFLKRTLVENNIEASKIKVLPLGFDISSVTYNLEYIRLSNKPLRILFVGRITQGKGIKYMLDAMEKLKSHQVELHIVGNIIGSGKEFHRRKHLYTYHGSMSQSQVFSFYQNFDGFLFPSLMEGFPLAVIEAMGAGLPVITTPNTSAEELIIEGETGYIIPIRDVDAIVTAIYKLINLSVEEHNAMRRNARQKALEYTWDAHRNRLKLLLQTV